MQNGKVASTSMFLWNIYFHRIKQVVHLSPAILHGAFDRGPATSKFCLRPFCVSEVHGKRLKNVEKSKENAMKDRYPKMHKGNYGKSLLGELIKELKGEPEEKPLKKEAIGRKETTPSSPFLRLHSTRVNPVDRVSALEKHANLQYFNQRKDSLVRKKHKLKIVPDDSEVGELLKAMTKGSFTEDMVKNVMANIKPWSGQSFKDRRSESVLRESPVKSQGERRPFGRSRLFDGPRTHYLDSLFKLKSKASDQNFVSIHDVKWKQTLINSVPKLGPTNAFELLMQEADKHWSFPIDNEAGLDLEDQFSFEDHVFLGEHLEIFPQHGQIRRFMELVITGLQQNPYCSVQEKVEKIYWFKDYFDKFSEEDLEF